jgi:hypothetical protein
MNTQEIYETASELLAGAILDAEQITASDAEFITDILAHQDYTLRVCPDLGIVYAVPEHYIH